MVPIKKISDFLTDTSLLRYEGIVTFADLLRVHFVYIQRVLYM